ncbi:hypothetical protein HOP50_02g15240 [Chloropicon primus]|nr:hypothetical protein A3770_02p15330 [Chloropicon primus]UPQ98224.1 hypothetical protein HOP50_02g15240 [Chloropicon primus]|eukprot:QDZ19015.1 hypothetical protein A3770_02p15330 [Chloropicon primus]
MMRARGFSLVVLALVAGVFASVASASTRNLQQSFLRNGIQAPRTLYIPGLGLSIAIGNVPGFYTSEIFSSLLEDGPLSGLGDLDDYGFDSLIEQAVTNSIALASDAATGSSTIVAGKK